MGAVGELDDKNTNIFRHRDCHLADRGRLGMFPARELDAVELGDTIDQERHLVAELLDYAVEREVRVFHCVVHQRGREGRFVHAVLCKDLGDGERVHDVWISCCAFLTVVPSSRDFVCLADRFGIPLRMGLSERLDDVREHLVGRSTCNGGINKAARVVGLF